AYGAGAQRPAVVGAGHRPGVVIDSDEIDRLADLAHVRVGHLRPGVAEDLRQLVGVAAEQGGMQVLLVHVRVRTAGGGQVPGRIAGRVFRLDVHHQADVVPALGTVGLDRGAVRARS